MSLQTEAFAAEQAARKRSEARLAPTISSWLAGMAKWNKDVTKYDPAKIGLALKSFYELHKRTAAEIGVLSKKVCRNNEISKFTQTTSEPIGYLCDLGVRENLFAESLEFLVLSANAVKEFGQYIEQCDKMAAENAALPVGERKAIELKNLKPVVNRCIMSMYHAMVAAGAAADIQITSWMGKAVLSVINGDFLGYLSAVGLGVAQGLATVAAAAFEATGRVVGFAADLATDALFALLKKFGLYAALGIGGYVAIKRYSNGKPILGG